MYFKHHYNKFDECVRCHRRYLEVNLIANYNSSRKHCDSFCIKCYNGRDKNETKETVNETLQRRIKKSVTGTTDHERISDEKEIRQVENNNGQAL